MSAQPFGNSKWVWRQGKLTSKCMRGKLIKIENNLIEALNVPTHQGGSCTPGQSISNKCNTTEQERFQKKFRTAGRLS